MTVPCIMYKKHPEYKVAHTENDVSRLLDMGYSREPWGTITSTDRLADFAKKVVEDHPIENKQEFECEFCGRILKNRTGYMSHMRTHQAYEPVDSVKEMADVSVAG